MKKTTIEFAAIPAWALPATPGALSFFETIALADLEGKWIRLSADTQRALLGSNVFGKQEIKVHADGNVTVTRSTCFGMDYESAPRAHQAGHRGARTALARRLALRPRVHRGRRAPAPRGGSMSRAENRAHRANEYGYEAGIEGDERRNPYGEGCAQHAAWEAGYEQGAQDLREIRNGA